MMVTITGNDLKVTKGNKEGRITITSSPLIVTSISSLQRGQ
jgi:hypothetical protein